jgi:hypothetical protein
MKKFEKCYMVLINRIIKEYSPFDRDEVKTYETFRNIYDASDYAKKVGGQLIRPLPIEVKENAKS